MVDIDGRVGEHGTKQARGRHTARTWAAAWLVLGTGVLLAQVACGDELPESARALVTEHDARVAELRARTERQVASQVERLCRLLEELAQQFRRDGNAEAVVAIRQQIAELRVSELDVQPDPGDLMDYEVGAGPLYFEVEGDVRGPIWGTEVYTGDSRLATAAVHAGVLGVGERGVVAVRMEPGAANYAGSEGHGVQSLSWGSYPRGYTVRRVGQGTMDRLPQKRIR